MRADDDRERFSSTMRFHHRNVSPLTTPPGFPPSVPATDFWDGSLMSLIIRNSRLPTRKEYRSHVPSIGNGACSHPRRRTRCAPPWDRPTSATTRPAVHRVRSVVIAGDIVDLLATMPRFRARIAGRSPALPHLWACPVRRTCRRGPARYPNQTRWAFRLLDRGRQAFSTISLCRCPREHRRTPTHGMFWASHHWLARAQA